MRQRSGSAAAVLGGAALTAACSNAGSGPEASRVAGQSEAAAVAPPAEGTAATVAAPHERTAYFGDLHAHARW